MPTAASRAVLRPIEPGSDAVCAHCGSPIKFAAREHHRQAIANVYVAGAWDRVEHFHESCYEEAGEPHGAPSAPDGNHHAAPEHEVGPPATAGEP
jgi:hypothetical protein